MQKLPSVDKIVLAIQPGYEKMITCSMCSLRFFSQESLRKHHLLIVDFKAEINETTNCKICKICNQEFVTFRGMRQHVGKIHNSVKKVKCKHCNKKFKDNYAVKYHRKQVHDKSTQVKCQICDKVLYNQYNFKKHLEVCQNSTQNFQEIPELEDLIDSKLVN